MRRRLHDPPRVRRDARHAGRQAVRFGIVLRLARLQDRLGFRKNRDRLALRQPVGDIADRSAALPDAAEIGRAIRQPYRGPFVWAQRGSAMASSTPVNESLRMSDLSQRGCYMIRAAGGRLMNRWRVVVGGVSMNLALGSLVRLERVRPAARAGIRLDAQPDVVGLHDRRRGLREHVRAGGPHSGSTRAAAVCAGGRHPGLARVLRWPASRRRSGFSTPPSGSSSAPATASATRRRCRSRRSGFRIGGVSSSG